MVALPPRAVLGHVLIALRAKGANATVVRDVNARPGDLVETLAEDFLPAGSDRPRPGASGIIAHGEDESAQVRVCIPDPGLPFVLASLVFPRLGRAFFTRDSHRNGGPRQIWRFYVCLVNETAVAGGSIVL